MLQKKPFILGISRDLNFGGWQWYPGHVTKTEKELKERLKLMDVIEIRDARIPMSTSHPQEIFLQDRHNIINSASRSELSYLENFHSVITHRPLQLEIFSVMITVLFSWRFSSGSGFCCAWPCVVELGRDGSNCSPPPHFSPFSRACWLPAEGRWRWSCSLGRWFPVALVLGLLGKRRIRLALDLAVEWQDKEDYENKKHHLRETQRLLCEPGNCSSLSSETIV
ncbi:hypothetical protein KSP39_PZI013959 [Platanthera zijinensis]|uniref:Uncharacterized protein n=1 Tax=Platanthera zijinensis TaxID=2320716 RepID=A0AAP0G2Z0_9ASPA